MLILSNQFLNINMFLNYQEFICEKGIGFVRIDGNTLATDRQSAVRSFQLSTEVRISCTIISKLFPPAFFLDVPTKYKLNYMQIIFQKYESQLKNMVLSSSDDLGVSVSMPYRFC